MSANTWVTSDTHFFHKNILKYNPDSRPYASVDEMNEALVSNWNEVVAPNDIIYHLGDFAFANPRKIEKILKQLNGSIRLILGNHDRVMTNKYIAPYFEWVRSYHEAKIGGVKVCLFHYPIAEWNSAHHGAVHFHGHLHSNRVYGRSMDVGCDSNMCKPYNMEDLVAHMGTLPIVSEYHEVRETELR